MSEESEFDRRWTLEEGQLELPIPEPICSKYNELTGKAGTTVQVLGFAPRLFTTTLQVHHKVEALRPNDPVIAIYGPEGKPPYYGNPGGGMEPDELERFQNNEPELYEHYSSLSNMSPQDLAVIGCALRESVDESGFYDIGIMLDESSSELIKLTDYHYSNGHRVITVWGQYNSYQSRPIREKDEIDCVAWIDFSMPMVEIFKKLRSELSGSVVYPFWSHVRRSLIGFSRIDQYHRDRYERPYLISRMIHPSWRLVFPVGRGDNRFPANGFQISPQDWYRMFDIMLEQGFEHVDNDLIFSSFRDKIVIQKDHEEPRLETSESTSRAATTIDDKELVGSEDYSGIPSSAEILQAEDEAYARWFEETMNLPQALRVARQ